MFWTISWYLVVFTAKEIPMLVIEIFAPSRYNLERKQLKAVILANIVNLPCFEERCLQVWH
jgi:hypothetical protein